MDGQEREDQRRPEGQDEIPTYSMKDAGGVAPGAQLGPYKLLRVLGKG